MGHVIAISSVGADRHSRSRYLRVKGETEDALIKLKLRRLDILRPGLLRGSRSERRPLERLAILASPFTDALMFGPARPYRSIPAAAMARAIIGLAKEKAGGRFMLDHDRIVRAARRGINPLPG
jgi:uncharacterized protein YbjT (DUF2867 family)